MNKKSGVIFNKDLKKEKRKEFLKQALYTVISVALTVAIFVMGIYALLTPDY